jgi:hypothetical protein
VLLSKQVSPAEGVTGGRSAGGAAIRHDLVVGAVAALQLLI